MAFVQFMEWRWPEDSVEVLSASILDVQAFKSKMVEDSAAPKTINRRISSLSSFYKFWPGLGPSCASQSLFRIRHTLSSFHESRRMRLTKRKHSH